MTSRIRGLTIALNSLNKYPFRSPEYDVDYLVIGGGAVGLAVARHLVLKYPEKTTILVERHSRVGEETSSRNSEVVHGGFYYPLDSLKTRLCIRGRDLLYEHCDSHSVPYKKVGKLVVGLDHQRSYLDNLYKKAKSIPKPRSYPPLSSSTSNPNNNPNNHANNNNDKPAVPVSLLSGSEARELEPNLSKSITSALLSSESGIVDSHTFMESLEKDILESEGGNGSIAYGTSVVRVDPSKSEDGGSGWVVQMVTGESSGQGDSVLARTVINSTGLSAPFILNSLFQTYQPDRFKPIPMYYAKGSYASYSGPGISGISHLIYPVPEAPKDSKGHGFAGLGTHLTLDLAGRIKFGPDIEWLTPPSNFSPTNQEFVDDETALDFWQSHLIASDAQIPSMYEAIKSYLPGITMDGLNADYVGIRPKLVGPGAGFQDFVIRSDQSEEFGGVQGRGGEGTMISLLGIESPGLTSSLAIGEMVVEEYLKEE